MPRTQRLHFLNIDIELRSRGSMTTLLAALAPEMFVLSRGRGAPGRSKTRAGEWARLEFDQQCVSINGCIRALARVVDSLGPKDRAMWDKLAHRELCIGLERDSLDWSPGTTISAASIRRAASIGCSISVVVYPLEEG